MANYYCKFDKNGKRTMAISSFDLDEQAAISQGYTVVSSDNYQYLIGNKGNGDNGTGYIYNTATGKIESAPAIITKYCYSNLGYDSKTVTSDYIVQDGEVLFDSEPTTDELKTAFPTTAGSITRKITVLPTADDIITFNDVSGSTPVSLKAGTDFEIGTDIPTTVQNIVSAMLNNSLIKAIYKITATDDTFTSTEIIAGLGNTPVDAETSGNVQLVRTDIKTSKKGYMTVKISNDLTAHETEYVSRRKSILEAFGDANTNPNLSEDEKQTLIDSIKLQRQQLINWDISEREVIINE